MSDWCRVKDRLTLHLFNATSSLCGRFPIDSIVDHNVKSDSKCCECKYARRGDFGNMLASHNDYMSAHYKSMGLPNPFPKVEVSRG